MRYDRRRYYTEKKLNNSAATRRIAQKKFDDVRQDDFFMATKETNSSYDEKYNREKLSTNIQSGILKGKQVGDMKRAKKGSKTNYNFKSKPVDIGKEEYLHSGKAALEIADAFLQGDLYCRLLGNPTICSVGDDAQGFETMCDPESDEWCDKDRSWDIGGQNKHLNLNMTSFEKPRKQKSVQISGTSTTSGQEEYCNGWRPAKGGWVADFGPLHTHALSFGNEGPKRKFQSNIPQKKTNVNGPAAETNRLKETIYKVSEENLSLEENNGQEHIGDSVSLMYHTNADNFIVDPSESVL